MSSALRPGRRLLLLRHGQTSWNLEGRAQGQADICLDAVGHAQAAAVAPYLASLAISAVWSSDLSRARETSEYLAAASGLSVKYDARLREFDVGERQGLTLAEFAARFPDEHRAWLRGDQVLPLAGGETTTEVRGRLVPALQEALWSLDDGETGVVVTHGAALKVGLAGLIGWPQGTEASLGGVDNCAWATVEEMVDEGRLRLAGYNEKPGAEVGPEARWSCEQR